MQWFNEPHAWKIEGNSLMMQVTPQSDYSFDNLHYTMMRNAWLQDNHPVMVGMMGASPDGQGFKAMFEHFSLTHLPDARRLQWLKANDTNA